MDLEEIEEEEETETLTTMVFLPEIMAMKVSIETVGEVDSEVVVAASTEAIARKEVSTGAIVKRAALTEAIVKREALTEAIVKKEVSTEATGNKEVSTGTAMTTETIDHSKEDKAGASTETLTTMTILEVARISTTTINKTIPT
jgi:hypothetical protein